jgi:hypothetical protein
MMIVFRTRRRAETARVRPTRPGLTEREVADRLRPMYSGHVEVAPVEPPEPDDGSIDPDERSQWAHRLP